MLELLSDVLQPGSKVLDVGSGTGILCAAFIEMGAQEVIGIEHIEHLAQLSVENLSIAYQDKLDNG